jgi:hypothetical protein
MAVEHRNLTGSALHEPKGASSAVEGTVYIADGSGSGTWSDPLAGINNLNLFPITCTIQDISNPSSVFIVPGIAGKIVDIHVALNGAITVADSIVTAKINTVPVTGISITAAYSGSAAGSVFSGTATALNTFLADDAIEIITNGGSSTSASATVTILVSTA